MIAAYLISITLANLIILKFGPSMTPITAFVLIALDLVIRDKLHDKISKVKMFLIILASGAITYLINADAQKIAMASSVSFATASFVDWSVFANTKGEWTIRSHKSNIAGAFVDSLLFPVLAFNSVLWPVIIGQFVAKTAGAAVWVYVFNRLFKNQEAWSC